MVGSKLAGERSQDQCRRRYSGRHGDGVDRGNFSPLLGAVVAPGVANVVLDLKIAQKSALRPPRELIFGASGRAGF